MHPQLKAQRSRRSIRRFLFEQLEERFFRPRLEILENRVYPGDTILGLWALGLWGPSFASHDGNTGSYRTPSDREWHHGLFSSLEVGGSFSALAPHQDSEGEGDRGGNAGARSAILPTFGTTSGAIWAANSGVGSRSRMRSIPGWSVLESESPGRGAGHGTVPAPRFCRPS